LTPVTLTPNDFADLQAVADRISVFGKFFMRTAEPFNWNFTREDLIALLKKIPSTVLDRPTISHPRNPLLKATG
jgi:hypothetical protein